LAAPFRADHVGSLLRPQEVLDAHVAQAQGKDSLAHLREVEDRAILTAIGLQKQVGLGVFSDGEYRRAAWASDFAESVDGYVASAPPVSIQWHTASGPVPPPLAPAQATTFGQVIGEKLRQKRRITAHESGFLKQHAPGPWKMTMPAASYVVARAYKPGITDRVYAGRAEVLKDVAGIINAEIKALIGEGAAYIQLDNPHYPDYLMENRREQWRALGIDPEQALREDVEADNACLQGIDRSAVTIAMHLCRGNGGRAGWHSEGAYDPIAEQVFGGIEVDRFLLEYDSERAGGFEPLAKVPRGKVVVLGLVTTKAGVLESEETLRQRIDAATAHCPLDQLALSPQCGFASVMEGNPLTWDEQRRKLELVVETARKVWQ